MGVLTQLFTPLSYMRIKHPVKPWFDWYVPLFITVPVFLILLFLPKQVDIFGNNGLVFVITDLIKILVGFYIAALAAIATFHREQMDQELSGEPATLRVHRKGVAKESNLTRRRFLCYLFGYLAFIGIFIYFVGAAATLLHSNVQLLPSVWWVLTLKWGFIFVYLYVTANLLSTTLLGLHFMTDRIHR